MGIDRLADHADLAVRRNSACNDYINFGGLDVLAEDTLDVGCQPGRRLAHGLYVTDEWRGNLAVRTNRYLRGEFRITPDKYLQRIARTDTVFRDLPSARCSRSRGLQGLEHRNESHLRASARQKF